MSRTTKEILDKARGNWHNILTEAGIPAALLRHKHTACPICGGKDRFIFKDTDGTGKYYCNSHGSNFGAQLLHDHLGGSWSETYKFLENFLWGGSYTPKAYVGSISGNYADLSEQEIADRKERLLNTWKRGVKVSKDDRYDQYLKSRGIDLPAEDFAVLAKVSRLVKYLGYAQFVYDPKTQKSTNHYYGSFPTILTQIVSGETGKSVNIHRNYLAKESVGKAAIFDMNDLDEDGQPTQLPSRKVMKASVPTMSGCYIPLFPAEGETKLGVGEGIETMLAVRMLAHNKGLSLPVWPTYSADMLAGLKLPAEVSSTLQELHIFADNDKVDKNGHRKGIECAKKLKAKIEEQYSTIKVFIHVPETEGDDWNDVLLKGGELPF